MNPRRRRKCLGSAAFHLLELENSVGFSLSYDESNTSARLSRQSRQTKNAAFARQELQKPPQSAQGTRFLFFGYPHLLSVRCVRFL